MRRSLGTWGVFETLRGAAFRGCAQCFGAALQWLRREGKRARCRVHPVSGCFLLLDGGAGGRGLLFGPGSGRVRIASLVVLD